MKHLYIALLFITQISFGQSFLKRWQQNYKTKKQENWATEHVYLQNAVALSFQNVQQQSFSKNQFAGLGLSGFRSKEVDRKRNRHGYETFVSASLISGPNSTSNTISSDSYVGYYYLYKFNEKFALGAQINMMVDFRINGNYDNNTIATETAVKFDPKFSYHDTFRFLKRDLGIHYAFSTSAIGYGLWTPTYTSNFTRTGLGLLSPKNFYHINSRLTIKLPSGKRFPSISPCLGYAWNAYSLQVNDTQKAINGIHSIYFIANIHKIK